MVNSLKQQFSVVTCTEPGKDCENVGNGSKDFSF